MMQNKKGPNGPFIYVGFQILYSKCVCSMDAPRSTGKVRLQDRLCVNFANEQYTIPVFDTQQEFQTNHNCLRGRHIRRAWCQLH